jgi:hypothetical protein
MPMSEKLTEAQKRAERLLADLAAEGSARCCYAPGCMSPEAWITGHCDCKYLTQGVTPSPMSEQTGCCEMRGAYRVLADTQAEATKEIENLRGGSQGKNLSQAEQTEEN